MYQDSVEPSDACLAGGLGHPLCQFVQFVVRHICQRPILGVVLQVVCQVVDMIGKVVHGVCSCVRL